MNEPQIRDVYKRAIDMNAEAFTGEEYDLAYHALMVALHCGQRVGDVGYLREVERRALDQLRYIDTHRPEYPHSTAAAQTRGHFSIFETAARQAKTRILIIENAKTL
jgi:hypothetical protein